jgi:hypothetical protein
VSDELLVSRPKAFMAQLLATAAALGFLSACGGGGGGGGGPPPPTFSVTTQSLTFSASSPTAAAPAPQPVMASVTGTLSGTLYILINVTGPAVASVSNFVVSGNSGQGQVMVNAPVLLGIGTFTSTMTIRACLNDATCATGELSGSPRTVNVSYTISGPPLADTVMPHVVVTGTSGQVVIRGSGLTGTTSVSFGATPASSFSVINDSEVHATYPATLTAGSLAVSLNAGAKPFTGAVMAVAPVNYPAATLSFPAVPQRILATLYDAQRQVLYVAAAFSPTANNKLWRYAYSGGAWAAPQEIGVPDLRDIALPTDGSQLIALTSYSIVTYDAANPGAGPTQTLAAPFTSGGAAGTPIMESFAFANDGNALVVTGTAGGQGAGTTYLFAAGAGSFADLGSTNELWSDNNPGNDSIVPTMTSSADGSRIIATQSIVNAVFNYSASTALMAQTIQFAQPSGQPAAIDNNADKIVFYDGNSVLVYDSNFLYLGGIPTLTAGTRLTLVNPQGTRLYVLTQDSQLWPFDLTAATNAGAFPQTVAAVPQAIPSTVSPILRAAVTPDGLTLFIVGDAGVAVVPAPQ